MPDRKRSSYRLHLFYYWLEKIYAIQLSWEYGNGHYGQHESFLPHRDKVRALNEVKAIADGPYHGIQTRIWKLQENA